MDFTITDDVITIEVGEQLGSGAYKEVFTVKKNPHIALLVPIELFGSREELIRSLFRENDVLEFLRCNEVPAADIKWIGSAYIKGSKFAENKPYVVAIMQRAIAGNRVSDSDQHRDLLNTLNEKTIDDVKKIKAAMIKHDLDIRDIQCLFLKDGSILISDPLDARVIRERDFNHCDEFYFLKEIEEAAVYAIAYRSGLVKNEERELIRSPNFDIFQAGKSWCRKNGMDSEDILVHERVGEADGDDGASL